MIKYRAVGVGKQLALFGHGGHAREVAAHIGRPITFFVDTGYPTSDNVKCIADFDPEVYAMMVSVGDPVLRQRIVESLPADTTYFTFIHPTALILDPDLVSIGTGSFVGAYSIITTDVQIGEHAILNRGVHIGHDTRIGNYFSAMAGAIVSGNCNIGDAVYLGTNSSIREFSKLDNYVKLGANSCLVENELVRAGIYGGVPAKILRK